MKEETGISQHTMHSLTTHIHTYAHTHTHTHTSLPPCSPNNLLRIALIDGHDVLLQTRAGLCLDLLDLRIGGRKTANDGEEGEEGGITGGNGGFG